MNRYQIIKTEYPDRVEYTLNGLRHREDGPAVEWSDGSKEWFINGIRHRIDGPAIIYSSGRKEWIINGLLHREDGPAIEWSDAYKRTKAWYINNKELSVEQFIQYNLQKKLNLI